MCAHGSCVTFVLTSADAVKKAQSLSNFNSFASEAFLEIYRLILAGALRQHTGLLQEFMWIDR
jgi:hypothetical protein